MDDLENAGGEGPDSGFLHGGIQLSGAPGGVANLSPRLTGRGMDPDAFDGDREMETAMQHFHAGNRHKIKDAPPNTWATVDRRDVVTRSELARCGFHLVDMSGEVWTMRRQG